MDYQKSCLNCCRLHNGPCFDRARICWVCGEIGHIQRYCPNRPRHGRNAPKSELVPGTSSWCEALGLDDDPRLKFNITSTLKDNPGATIYLNDECIYRGVQTYFYRKNLPAGEVLLERLKTSKRFRRRRFNRCLYRRRSRSPSKERALKRSRSPLRRYSRENLPYLLEDSQYDIGRSVSPPLNVPARHRLSPFIDFIDIDMISPPILNQAENIPLRERPFPEVVGTQPLISTLQVTPSKKTSPAPRPRHPLAIRSANTPFSFQSLLDLPIDPSFSSTTITIAKATGPTAVPLTKAATHTSVAAAPATKYPRIEDPHFVLGISRGAKEDEIISGFQQRMWEIELERSSYIENHFSGSWSEIAAAAVVAARNSRWEESIGILNAAKAQLLDLCKEDGEI